MNLTADLGEVHVTSLEGLGASYRIQGFFQLKSGEDEVQVNFDAVAFGGNYGGHNVSVNLSGEEKSLLKKERKCTDEEIEELVTEVQRKMLNNDMIVEYDKLTPREEDDGMGNISP